MPLIQISTNVPKEKITNELNLHFVDLVADLLKKPKDYVACNIMPDQMMSFGGSFEPCAQVLVQSVGRLGVEENKAYSKAIFADLESKLGIAPNRAYIFFHDVNFFN